MKIGLKKRSVLSTATLALFFATRSALALQPPPAATVTAKKGPVQITLRLYKTTVKREKSLWYQIELKNVGKKKILIQDKIFRYPWAMHDSIFKRYGIYLDMTAPPGRYEDTNWPPNKFDGRSPQLRMGAGRLHYDFGDRNLTDQEIADAKKELTQEEAKWSQQGLTDLEKKKARIYWNSDWNRRKEDKEDSSKTSWLAPGASTTTFAWAYWDSDPYAVHSGTDAAIADEEPQVGDYTQLWSYKLYYPGRYRIRAIYQHGIDEDRRKSRSKYHVHTDSWEVSVKTPYVDVEVLP